MNAKIFGRRSITFQILVLTVLALSEIPANAWNSVGHRAVAEIAWRQMDKKERSAATALLKRHPHYKELLAANAPDGVKTDEWVFLSAAVWPDWVRPAKEGNKEKPDSITKYDLYPHAVGYPFLGDGETNRALLENFYIAKPDAEMVLSNSIATLKDPKASKHDRAVSLCWMLHLFGDLHQPLHAANVVTTARPRGDRLGGNHIALDSRGKQINLHTFWDSLPGLDSSYKTIATLADELAADSELKISTLKDFEENKTIAAWVQESFRIAAEFAYSPKHVRFVHADELKSGKVSERAIPALPANYISEARRIAERRVWLAGQRLAEELKQAF
jgi:hypothetical protein